MERERITLVIANNIEGLDRIVHGSAGNPIISSNLSNRDFVCGNCGDVIVSGEDGAPVNPGSGRLLLTCSKCGKYNIWPPELLPGASSR